VLELNFLPPPPDSIMDPTDWSGVTQSLGTVGQDLTKVQYIEVWVNDFQKDHTQTRGKLHLDFGRIAEDAFWDRNNLPNLQLDTEDKNGNGILDRPVETDGKTPLPEFEDTGLDGKLDKDEPGYVADVTPDPNGDDYSYTSPSKDYSGINKTEGNGVEPESRPDTEDLNQNGVLDTGDDFLEASLDLSESQYLAIDVPQLYKDYPLNADNGWRLFRIPVSEFQPSGSAHWARVNAVRLIVEGVTRPLRLQLGGIRFMGVPSPAKLPPIVLHQNRPNPFNPTTSIQYETRDPGRVQLDIFDVAGRHVKTLIDQPQGPGIHWAFWTGQDEEGHPVPAGVYLYRLRTAIGENARRMVLIK